MTPEAFAWQMDALARNGMRGISLREAMDHLGKFGEWPERAVVLTFDDGYANFHEAAMPALTRHGFTATVFLIGGYVGKGNSWEGRPMLTWPQVIELDKIGIEMGAHTMTHPDLRKLSRKEAREEIVGANAEIAGRLGKEVDCFAYPFGYYDRRSLELVRQEYQAACTTRLQRADQAGDRHELPRVDMYYLQSPERFQRLLEGRLDGYLRLRRWGRNLREAVTRG